MPKDVKVTLVSGPQNPVETIYTLWQQSRTRDPLLDPAEVAKWDVEKRERAGVDDIFQKVIQSAIPVAENLFFVFVLENVSIELREQMVRHRIGVKQGDRLGADMVPDLQGSTWWSQSMRILDMGTFFDDGDYRLPESIAANPVAQVWYQAALRKAQDAYHSMVGLGVPAEDARAVIPLGATHRLSWGLSFPAIQHILSKRSCWILQLGLWEPVIRGVLDELTNKVHKAFNVLRDPPCFTNGQWTGCTVKLDNELRCQGKDKLPPCSLYLEKHPPPSTAWGEDKEMVVRYHQMRLQYGGLWRRNPTTGEPTDARR